MNYSPNIKEIDRNIIDAETALTTFDEQFDETGSGYFLLLKAITHALLAITATQTPRDET